MRQRLKTLAAALLTATVLASCASPRTMRSQSDFNALPHSTGLYGGSFIIHTWEYIGSDAKYDNFIYTYISDNLDVPIHVRVTKGLVVLEFSARPYRLPDAGIPVIPHYRHGRITGFSMDTN